MTVLARRIFSRLSPARRNVLIVGLLSFFIATFFGLSNLNAQVAGFSTAKKLCLGNPATLISPESCVNQSPVTNNVPVYYVISVTNPPGEFAKSVKIADSFPPGFQQQGPIFCRDETGLTVPLTTPTPPIGTIALGANKTVHCFVPGQFVGATAALTNNATFTNKETLGSTNSSVNTNVTAFDPVPTDISVTKTGSVTSLNVSGGPQTMSWTITVKNNGPSDVDMGNWFKLHDLLALKPASVPFKVTLISATCTPFTPSGAAMTTDCLDAAGPVPAGPMPMLIGTMAPKPFFSWGYAGSGKLPVGGTMTLTIATQIEELPSLNCFIQPASDGIRNTTFFTLTNPNGSAKSDTVSANNTAIAQVALVTGNATQADDCGTGHLKITKIQTSPTGTAGWGVPVTYRIEIVNQSLPAQPITIKAADLEDWVTQGIGTPPFTRNFGGVTCMPGSSPGVCAQFSPGAASTVPNFGYSYYGQTDKAWASAPGSDFTLMAPGDKIVLRSTFKYTNPDCETVPLVNPKIIRNTVKVRYQASAYGAATATPQNESFQQWADRDTKMAPQPPCKFKVTKQQISPAGPVPFGADMTYKVTFTNNGADRTVNTVGDFVRLTQPGYQTALNFSSSWICLPSSPGAVIGFAPFGSIAGGMTTHTTSPAQGAPAVNLRSNPAVPLWFKMGASLNCTVKIKVQRPPYGSNLCSAEPTEFENLALMDVTHPFNSNVPWPVSGSYNAASGTIGAQPSIQNRNWASVRTALPKCFDAIINKTASVAGLPNWSQPWTFIGGPDIDYNVTVENSGNSVLTGSVSGSNWNGLAVADGLSGGAAIPGTPLCSPTGWCSIPPFNTPAAKLGVATLGPEGSVTATGTWKIKATMPFTQPKVRNCAKLVPEGDFAGPGWYSNYNQAAPQPNPQYVCVDVPVVKVTKFQIVKLVSDTTGAGTTAAGPFTISVTCLPHALSTATATFPLTTGTSGASPIHTVINVPTTSNCTIAETATPAPPGLATEKCIAQYGQGASAYWETQVLPGVFPNPFPGPIQVRNILRCKPPATESKLTIQKQFVNPSLPNGTALPPQTFNFSAVCTSPATPGAVSITTTGTAINSETVSVPAGAVCTVTEMPPAVPPLVEQHCQSQGGSGAWQMPSAQSVTVPASGATVSFVNRWYCKPAS